MTDDDAEKFSVLKAELSNHYIGRKYLWLRFVLFDQLALEDIASEDNMANDLLNALQDKGVITRTQVQILLEIAILTELKQVVDIVLQYMKYNNVNRVENKLSSYRRKLFKALRQVDPAAFNEVIDYYGPITLYCRNIWDVVFKLEINGQLADEPDKIYTFACRLGQRAKNILLDGVEEFIRPEVKPGTSKEFKRQTSPEVKPGTSKEFKRQTSPEVKPGTSKEFTRSPSPKDEIPYFITARGKLAEEAYIEALKEGTVKVNLGMLKVIGQEGVGKTCLINACLGKEFVVNHVVTDGIAEIRIINRNWTEDTADNGNPKKQYTKCCNDELNAKKKNNEGAQNTKQMNTETSIQEKQDVDKTISAKDTANISFDANRQLDKDVIKEINENKGETCEDTLRIWDHGGQLIYHGITRIFMTSEALYIVVFDLSKDINAHPTVADSTGEHTHHWSNLQFILSFILTVYSHSRDVKKNMEKGVHQPTILIVGTHKGELGETEEEQNAEAQKVFGKIEDAIKDTPYAKHVLQYFAIENKLQDTKDKSFSDLKEVIDDLMTTLEKPVPLKWMRFRCDLQNLREENLFCPFKEIKTLASKNGINEQTQLSHLLYFLFDLGEIIYMPDKDLLRDQVVLDPMEFVKIVTAFVTVVPPNLPKPMYRDAFKDLEKGILAKDLLRKLWNIDIGKHKLDIDKHEFLVKLMIELGFICKRETSSQDRSQEMQSFFVPLRLAFNASSEVKPVPDDSQSISVYYDFKGYLPDVLFPYMIIEFLNNFQKKGCDPKLRCNHAELYFDQFHHVTLSLVKFVTKKDERPFLLKVTIKRKSDLQKLRKVEQEPDSEACKQVLSTVEKSFQPSQDGGRRGIQFDRCIPCCCSDKSEKKHIQFLEDFQYEMLPCNGDGMDVKRYKRLFEEKQTKSKRTNADQDEIKPTKLTETDQVDSNQLEDKFNKLNDDLSEVFMKLKRRYLFLRCCLFEHIELQVLASQSSIAKSLFNELYAKQCIKPTDVSLLLEVVKLSENKYAEDLVKQYMEDNNVQNVDEQKLSPYRKRLCRALTQFDPNELNKVNASYEMESLTIWDVVFALESKKKLADESQKERLAELLGAIPKEILCADS